MDCTIEFENILNEFLDREAIMSVSPYGEGHINGTFLVETKNKKYILQQINTKVFPDVEKLMENTIHVTDFLVSKNVTITDEIIVSSADFSCLGYRLRYALVPSFKFNGTRKVYSRDRQIALM